MWLPETAVDDETLDVLAAEGIRFTDPRAAPGGEECPPAAARGGTGRAAGATIALFVYDGPLSHDVAFGPAAPGRVRVGRAPDRRGTGAGPAPGLARDRRRDLRAPPPIRRDGAGAGAGDPAAARRTITVTNYAASWRRSTRRRGGRSWWRRARGAARTESSGGGRDCGCRVAPERAAGSRSGARRSGRRWTGWPGSCTPGLRARRRARCSRTRGPRATRTARAGQSATRIDRRPGGGWHAAGTGARGPVRARELLEMERDALRAVHLVRLVLRRHRRAGAAAGRCATPRTPSSWPARCAGGWRPGWPAGSRPPSATTPRCRRPAGTSCSGALAA